MWKSIHKHDQLITAYTFDVKEIKSLDKAFKEATNACTYGICFTISV